MIFDDQDGRFGPAGEAEEMAFFRDFEGNLVGSVGPQNPCLTSTGASVPSPGDIPLVPSRCGVPAVGVRPRLRARGYWLVTSVYLVVVADLSPAQLVAIGIVQGITVVLAEIPAGVLADTVSRKWSLVVADLRLGHRAW